MIIKYRSVSDDINPKYTIKLCFAHMKNYSHNFCFVNELLKITVDDLDLIGESLEKLFKIWRVKKTFSQKLNFCYGWW